MVCDRAACAGYLELLPQDDAPKFEKQLEDALHDRLLLSKVFGEIQLKISETYNGHITPPDHPLCKLAKAVCAESALIGFNSGCEAGLRATILGTPTLVWGPGSLAQAHAINEYVDWASVLVVARRFATFATRWCSGNVE